MRSNSIVKILSLFVSLLMFGFFFFTNVVNAMENNGEDDDRYVEKVVDYLAFSTGVSLLREEDVVSEFNLAIRRGDLDTVKRLVEQGENVNAIGLFRRTPIYEAINSNKLNIVEYLVAKGADLDVRDYDNKTPLDYAIEKDFAPIVSFLAQASVNGLTPPLKSSGRF